MTNLSKDVWDRALWRTIHSLAAAADTYEKRLAYRSFIYSLTQLLPCDECRYHFSRLLLRCPLDDYLDSNVSLLKWSWIVHNDVNKRLNKSLVSFDSVYQFYLSPSSQCTETCSIPQSHSNKSRLSNRR